MRLSDRLQRIIEGLPPGGSFTLPVNVVREWLEDLEPEFRPDLTVPQVAEFFGRSPSTIRTWIRKGDLRAYVLQGHEYRITRQAAEELQQRRSTPKIARVGLG